MRARIRHQVLPMIERELQPAIVTHLGRLAQMAREDEAFWQAMAAERLATMVHRKGSAGEGLRRDSVSREGVGLAVRCAELLAPLPWAGANVSEDARMAVSRRLVRGLVEELRGDCRELSAQHVEQVLRLAGTGSSGPAQPSAWCGRRAQFRMAVVLPCGGGRGRPWRARSANFNGALALCRKSILTLWNSGPRGIHDSCDSRNWAARPAKSD